MTNKEIANRIREAGGNIEELENIANEIDPLFPLGTKVLSDYSPGVVFEVVSQQEYEKENGRFSLGTYKPVIFVKDGNGNIFWNHTLKGYTVAPEPKLDEAGVFYLSNIFSPRIKDRNGNWFWVNEFYLGAKQALSDPSCYDYKANTREATMGDFEKFVKENPAKAAKIIHNLVKFVVDNNK